MRNNLSRRSFLVSMAASPLVVQALAAKSKIPVGLELFSVREELGKDLMGTVRAVAKVGYDGVEFFSPYFGWTTEQAREVRKLMDDLGIVCFSTHNGGNSFTPENIGKAIELNTIIGSKIIVMASAGRVNGLSGWQKVAEQLNQAAEKAKAAGLRVGFHNHQAEFQPVEGDLPMNVLAKNTGPDVVLQLDVGTCVEVGQDPVKWIEQNPGRIVSVHCKDYSPEAGKGYRVLFGEGVSPWQKIFEAAERVGGVQAYLIEQEGSAYPPLETVEKCLANYKKMRS
ncbi:MAG: sugar phosphate isomerase/epimerase [Acidobacteria bacterium]|nr:MAG: sugar phosphate isomerase/epimerase [Acidobacteriota bacterium]